MFERVDLDKMANALAKCLNFVVTPQGPITSRLGTRFVAIAKATGAGGASAYTRLIAFNFSQTQNFAIAVSAGAFRFYALGAVLLAGAPDAWNAAVAYSPGATVSYNGGNYYCKVATSAGDLPTDAGSWVAVGATVAGTPAAWSATPAYAAGALASYGGFNFYCIAATTPGTLPGNTAYWYALPASGEYEIPNPFAQADLSSLHYVQSGDVITLVHPNYPPMELQRYGNLQWLLSVIAFQSTFSPPAAVSAAATAPNATYPETFQYKVTTLDTIGTEESLPSAATAAVSNDLTVSGDFNTVTWTAATPPAGKTIGAYNIYKAINGGAFGYAGQVPFGTDSFTDNNITPDMTQTPPMSETIFNSPGNYPGAVAYYEQRRFFAGSDAQPQNVWATQSGTESNMNYSIPSQASDALRFGIWAKGQNQILHLVQSIDLMALTASNEFRIYTASGDALTPSTLTIKSQAQNGAANVMPVTVNNYVIYPQYNGGRIREMSFDWTIQGYKTVDLCLLAQHLFDGYTIADMAFTHTPNPIIWAINSAGVLLGLTYVPDQQVQAWHQHVTGAANGDAFESCCSIPENGADRLYVVVRRTVNGQVVRYVEYLDPPAAQLLAESFYVDSGATFSGASPVTSVSGLSWLEGENVSILADGYVMPDRVVSGGSVSLDFAASVVQVGLPFDAVAVTPPPVIPGDPDLSQSRVKDVNDVWVRVLESGGFWAGPYSGEDAVDQVNLVQVNPFTFAPSAPAPLISDVLQLSLYSSLNESGQVMLQMSDPLPMTVVGVTMEVAVGG